MDGWMDRVNEWVGECMNKEMPSGRIQVWAGAIFGCGLSQDPGSYDAEFVERWGKISLLPFSHLLHPIQLPASLYLSWVICGDTCENNSVLLQSSGMGAVGAKKTQHQLGPCPRFSCSWKSEELLYKVKSTKPWSTSVRTKRTFLIFFFFQTLEVAHQ